MNSIGNLITNKISILVPVYNSEAYLRRTLDSIAAQSYRNFICLLADDVSTDNSSSIYEEYARLDSRFHVLRNKETRGWIGNVNYLLDQVATEFFMIMPHDDVLAPSYLECLVRLLNSNSEAIISFTDMEVIYPDGERAVQSFILEDSRNSAKDRCSGLFLKAPHWWVPYRGLVKTRIAANKVRLRKSLAGEPHADRVWVLELAMRGKLIRYPEVLYTKYRYFDSVSRLWKHNSWETIASFLSCMRAISTGPLSFLCKIQLILLVTRKILMLVFRRIKR